MILPDMNYWYVWCYMILLDIYIYIYIHTIIYMLQMDEANLYLRNLVGNYPYLASIHQKPVSFLRGTAGCVYAKKTRWTVYPGEDLGGRNRHLASSLERWMDFQAPIFCQEKPLVGSFPLNGTCFQSSLFGWGGVWLILKHLQISMATLQPEIWRERLYQSNTVNTCIYCNS